MSINNYIFFVPLHILNPLNAELNPICHLLTLLGAHHILHVSRVRVNLVRGSDGQTVGVRPNP